MKNILFAILLPFISTLLRAQVPFELYNYDLKFVNPGFTGTAPEQSFNTQVNFLRKSNTFSDSDNLLLSYENQLTSLNSGMGIIFQARKSGPIALRTGGIAYSYQLRLKESKKLNIGTALHYLSATIEPTPIISPFDPVILIKDITDKGLDMDLGFAYENKGLKAGISVKNLLKNELKTDMMYIIGSRRYFNFYLSESITLSEKVKLNPYALLSSSTDFNRWQLDLNASVRLLNTILLGLTLQNRENEHRWLGNLGFNIKDRVQLIGLVYPTIKGLSSKDPEPIGQNGFIATTPPIPYEFMLRVKIPKGQMPSSHSTP